MPHEWPEDDTQISVIALFDKDNGRAWVDPQEENLLDAEYSAYLDSGKTKDKLLTLKLMDGDLFKIACSNISNWSIRSMYGILTSERMIKEMTDRIKMVNPDFDDTDD